jgi:hypothetical protein
LRVSLTVGESKAVSDFFATFKMDPSHLTPAASSLSFAVSCDPTFNYAFQQNAIPVVKEPRFQNDDFARKDPVIRVSRDN